jgi:ArsR family transcriptional regulator, cadmium/lead-responsive transcriptional repressor
VNAEPIFDALGDPTRRRILSLLSARGPVTATALAGELAISRQAVAKHLDLLRESGLAEVERVGREARYRLVPEPLDDAATWLRAQADAWDGRIRRVQAELSRRE